VSGQVALLTFLAFTWLFVGLFGYGLCRSAARPHPSKMPTINLTTEERAQWEQIERLWQ
jgi:hypothetical protein